jgi:hypothetical protein
MAPDSEIKPPRLGADPENGCCSGVFQFLKEIEIRVNVMFAAFAEAL